MPLTDILKSDSEAPAAPSDRPDDVTTPPLSSGPVVPALKAGSLLTREDAESFKKFGVEVKLRSPFGTFWLVPARTGRDRLELTPEVIVALTNVVHAFGGRITAVTRDGKPLPDADPAALAVAEALGDLPPAEPTADDARAHLRQLREQVPAAAGAPSQADAPQTQPSLFFDAKDGAR